MRPPTRFVSVMAFCLVSLACQEQPTAPEAHTLQFEIVSGSGQEGMPGEELSEPLVVRVTNQRGMGLPRQLVNFRVVEGGGTMWAGTSLTDRRGFARDYWTLGPDGTQQVEVRSVDPSTGVKELHATFSAVFAAVDLDGDGFASDVDCDDGDPAVNPGAVEIADGIDNDCDGDVDEGFSPEVCDNVDNDGDGSTDEGLPYCFGGVPAPNTDGAACLEGFFEVDGDFANGCEASLPDYTLQDWRVDNLRTTDCALDQCFDLIVTPAARGLPDFTSVNFTVVLGGCPSSAADLDVSQAPSGSELTIPVAFGGGLDSATLCVWVDPVNQQAESDEGNNKLEVEVGISPIFEILRAEFVQ